MRGFANNPSFSRRWNMEMGPSLESACPRKGLGVYGE
jgi:hypothetical protein